MGRAHGKQSILEEEAVSYLQPPPDMSPVVVVKDFGGYVDQYMAQTEVYRRTGREVRIHECHSACTMALSLPNVCVYRSSVFKFHQAYDPRDHVTNWAVTGQLFGTYPVSVRDRLGALTKQFTVLKGGELIELGVRDCEAPEPRVMVAQATLKPLPDSMTAGASGLSLLEGKLQSMIPSFGAKTTTPANGSAPRRIAPTVPDELLRTVIPLPPEKPASLGEPDASGVAMVPDTGGVPLPPPRPRILLVAYTPGLPPIPFMRSIEGSQPILPGRFVPFPTRKG